MRQAGTSRIVPAAGNLVLLGAAFLALAPLLLLLMNAFKPHSAILRNPLSLPRSVDFANFVSAWRDGGLGHGLVNSVLLSGSTILVTVSLGAMAAYPLARRKLRAWKLISLYFLGSVTVPIQIFLFPLFFVYARLGLIGNLFATSLILAAINLPLAIFLLRATIVTIPTELDDAAMVDGAGPWATFWHIILPLMRPGLVTVSIVTWLASWNEFLITSTFQQGQANFTMTLAYWAMNGSITTDQGLLMAGAVLVLVPVLIIFLVMQRFFVAGLTSGAVKG